MEGIGGWIPGEVPNQDMKMIEALLEVMEKVSKQILREDPNPF